MTRRIRVALTGVALTVAMATAGLIASTSATADQGHRDGRHEARTAVFTLGDSSHGNPEGVASDGKFFYTGATGDGTIYRGRLGDPTVHTLIAGAAGRAAVGMKVFGHWLYVAGGPTGKIFVFDLRHPGVTPLTFETGPGGFLNDLVVTRRGDVYVTDSFRPMLWHIAPGQLHPGGMVDSISVSPQIPFAGGGAFNLNGIVAFRGGRQLIVDDTANGALYRIDVERRGARMITQVDAPALVGGDGMLVDSGRLIVVRGAPASLTFLKLSGGRSRAKVTKVVADSTLRGPSTVARLKDRYLVVNADFATSTKPFTISGLHRG